MFAKNSKTNELFLGFDLNGSMVSVIEFKYSDKHFVDGHCVWGKNLSHNMGAWMLGVGGYMVRCRQLWYKKVSGPIDSNDWKRC